MIGSGPFRFKVDERVPGAIDQEAFMTAVTGEDASYRHTPIGYFCPDTPMASDAGLDVFKGPRDFDKVKRDLKAAGYAGDDVRSLTFNRLRLASIITQRKSRVRRQLSLRIDNQVIGTFRV